MYALYLTSPRKTTRAACKTNTKDTFLYPTRYSLRNRMLRSAALLLLLIQVISANGQRTCLSNCTIKGSKGQPFSIANATCSNATGKACQVEIYYEYYWAEYKVVFSTTFSPEYDRFIYVIPSDHLSYTATYACSENDTCSLEFAQKKVLDLSRRLYNTSILMEELAPILQESRPAGATLSCFDNGTCSDGMCKIEHDTC